LPTSTTPAELLDFAEAPGRFLESTATLAVRASRRYALVAERGGTWAAVEGIRLEPAEIEPAVAEVHAFLAETGTRVASWWLTERATPDDLEERLLDAGLARDESDYLHAAMLAAAAPPAGPPVVEARRVADRDELAAARRLKAEVFGTEPDDGERSSVTYGAWLDGELVATAEATFASVGALLTGGATLPHARGRGAYRALVRARWDDAVARGTPVLTVGAGPMSRPILDRLGFEQVLQFRRLESRLVT
jgi:hypothetical protein